MQIRAHDDRVIDDPTDGDIARVFESLRDPGDFVRLVDPALGEVRAAGPEYDGTFLLQCDLPQPGRTFRGELASCSPDNAVRIFQSFRAGQTQWSEGFYDPEPTPAPRKRALPVSATLVAVALFLALFWRAA